MEEVTRTIAAEYHWPDFGPLARTRLASAPKDTDRYVGPYQMTRFVAMMVSRQGDTLVLQQQGSPPEQFYPESDRVWFSTQSDRRIVFDVGPDGHVIDLALGGGGPGQKLKRLTDADMSARQAELAARVKAQVADARSEAVVRALIGELREGRPNYDHLGDRMAEVVRAQLPDIEGDIKSLGDLKTLAFKGVGPGGGDIWEATFANGKRVFRVLLDTQGRVDAMGIQLG
jgi:hypothetical protein